MTVEEANKKLRETNWAFLNMFERVPINELGKPLQSQAVELIRSGWNGVGYLMVANQPHPDTGSLWGCKRVAHDVQSAKELDEWFRARVAQGYKPLFRYYLSTSRKMARVNADYMKGTIIHEERAHDYTILVESMYLPGDVPSEIIEYAAEGLGASSVASEFALTVSMCAMGAKVLHVNSSPKEITKTADIPMSRIGGLEGRNPRSN